MKCDFCEIVCNENRTIAENELAWAFLTYTPITPGHTLVIPKRCVSTFEELTQEEIVAIKELSTEVKHALIKAFDLDGFNFAFNEGEKCGQSVPHFHLHIVPRKVGDNGIYEYEPRSFLYRPGSRAQSSQEELKEIVKLVQDKL